MDKFMMRVAFAFLSFSMINHSYAGFLDAVANFFKAENNESVKGMESKEEVSKTDIEATKIDVSESKSQSKTTSDELDQKQLFTMIRKGVVAIKVNAHLILGKFFNDKMWHGTGFIVDIERGLIVTNAHVAGEMSVCTYEVKFGNGKTAEAKLEYIDPCYDFAVLSVKKEDIPQYCMALEFSKEPISLNATVYSMGNSSLNEFSTYQGYVFDTESILWLKPIAEQSFQFSGLTVPGASGSPVFDAKGSVIGLLYGGKGVSGAALPITYIKPILDSIKQGKKFTRYFHGCIINYTSIQEAIDSGAIPKNLSNEYDDAFKDSNNKILFVSKKVAAFDGAKNPVEAGDIIWKVDGVLIGANLKKIDEIVQEKSGNSIEMTVFRKGKELILKVPVHELSIEKKLNLLSFAGTTFFETTDELKIGTGKIGGGVYITDSEMGSPFMAITSPNGQSYIPAVDIFNIVEIEGKRVSSINDLVSLIPELLKKRLFTVKFVKMSGDSQESSVIVKYSPEFADATHYTFNQETKSWDVAAIKNPSQKKE